MPVRDSGQALSRVARRNSIVETYGFLIRPIARQLKASIPPSFPSADLEQIGALGLIEAAAAFESYARQKIRGAMLDSLRGEWPEGTREALPSHYDAPDPAPSPEALVIQVEASAQLHAAIASLSQPEAEVLTIRFSKSQRQTAKELGVSQNAVHKREKSAVRKLRGKLAA